jgi:rod shape determining protein RodA
MQQKSLREKIDWPTIYYYIALVVIGWLAIYAAERQSNDAAIFDLQKSYGKQMLWIGISAALAICVLVVDSKLITTLPYVLYALILVLMMVVAVVARNVNGATAWLDIGGFKLQPSEFSKCITALALAKYLSQNNVNFKLLSVKIRAIALIIIPAIIIILQKDTGSALVYAAFILVLYREGLPGFLLVIGASSLLLLVAALLLNKWILFGILSFLVFLVLYNWRRKLKKMTQQITVLLLLYVSCAVFVLFGVDFVMNKVLEPHQRVRVRVLFGVEKDKKILKKYDYNVAQSKIAIGSGGFFGKGFLQGTQTQFKFVPEQSTDFIFCTIGEEKGFLGTSIVLILYLLLLLRIVNIAERQRSKFSRIYAYSVACVLFMHIMINVGMTMGLLPVIGIPLPYLSYGGSSLIGFTLLLFILLKLDTDRMAVLR